MSARPDYGVDGWIYVVGLLGAGAALGVAAVILVIATASSTVSPGEVTSTRSISARAVDSCSSEPRIVRREVARTASYIWTRETSATTRTSVCSRMSRSRTPAIVEARRGPERA